MSNGQGDTKPAWVSVSLFIVLLILMIFVGLFVPQFGLAWAWIGVAILMLPVFVLVGVSLGKGIAGILIDPATNMMSLSRLQVVLWTGLVLSAFITVALGRVGDSRLHSSDYCSPPKIAEGQIQCTDPLGIQLPQLLWALVGISITTAVGSPLLKAAKAQRTAEEDRNRVRAATKRTPPGGAPEPVATYTQVLKQRETENPIIAKVATGQPNGVLVRKDSWTEATFSDLFTGEEVSNFMYVDIAKVQNFFFTMIAVTAYAVALWVAMSTAGSIAKFFMFPDLPSGLVAIISISHTGYLTDKAFTHSTPTTPPQP
jgi:hypothetical protein